MIDPSRQRLLDDPTARTLKASSGLIDLLRQRSRNMRGQHARIGRYHDSLVGVHWGNVRSILNRKDYRRLNLGRSVLGLASSVLSFGMRYGIDCCISFAQTTSPIS